MPFYGGPCGLSSHLDRSGPALVPATWARGDDAAAPGLLTRPPSSLLSENQDRLLLLRFPRPAEPSLATPCRRATDREERWPTHHAAGASHHLVGRRASDATPGQAYRTAGEPAGHVRRSSAP